MIRLIIGCIFLALISGCNAPVEESSYHCVKLEKVLTRAMGYPTEKTSHTVSGATEMWWWYDEMSTLVVISEPLVDSSHHAYEPKEEDKCKMKTYKYEKLVHKGV